MGAEDFACFLKKNARRLHPGSAMAPLPTATLHNSHYDFNDDILCPRRQLLGAAGRNGDPEIEPSARRGGPCAACNASPSRLQAMTVRKMHASRDRPPGAAPRDRSCAPLSIVPQLASGGADAEPEEAQHRIRSRITSPTTSVVATMSGDARFGRICFRRIVRDTGAEAARRPHKVAVADDEGGAAHQPRRRRPASPAHQRDDAEQADGVGARQPAGTPNFPRSSAANTIKSGSNGSAMTAIRHPHQDASAQPPR